ncbi:hypothetical protein PU01_22360 [Hafnia alvei]|nr:hypothetical protein PU01_22360 [Hafnia alvei]
MVNFLLSKSEEHNRRGANVWATVLLISHRTTEMEVRVMIELVIAILNLVAAALQLINWFL